MQRMHCNLQRGCLPKLTTLFCIQFLSHGAVFLHLLVEVHWHAMTAATLFTLSPSSSELATTTRNSLSFPNILKTSSLAASSLLCWEWLGKTCYRLLGLAWLYWLQFKYILPIAGCGLVLLSYLFPKYFCSYLHQHLLQGICGTPCFNWCPAANYATALGGGGR
jgi:hypothetical protein